jgi:hypothetical protein
MKANEIINEMFRQSPIQKEWIPKAGDLCDKGLMVRFSEAHYYKCYRFDAEIEVYIKGDIVTREFKVKDVVWHPTQNQLQKKYWDNVGGPTEMCEPDVETVCKQLIKIDKTFTALSTWESSNDIVTRHPIVKGLNALSYPDLFHLLWCILVHQEVRMPWSWGNSTAKWDWKNNVWIKNDR